MDKKEAIFFWIAAALYVASAIAGVYSLVFRKNAYGKASAIMARVGFFLHTAAIVSRWVATGHAPVIKTYENTLAGSWVVVLFLFYLERTIKSSRIVSAILLPFAVLMMGYGVMNAPTLDPNSPVYRTPWLVVHIVFAWFAYSSFTAAFALGIVSLLKEKHTAAIRDDGFLAGVPAPEILGETTARFIAFGFITQTIMILAGSIWASRLWGSYWSWDPVETWSLISWLLYGIYLHLWHTFRWRGRVMSVLAVVALVTVIISFWGINYTMQSLHKLQTM